MALKNGRLTPMEREFAKQMARTGDKLYAATKAGYAQPAVRSSQTLQRPEVQEEIRRQAQHRLRTEGAQIGVDVLIELAQDKKQKGSTRGMAAKSLVQLSGIAGANALSEADLAEMPAEKIRGLLAEAERLLSERMAAARVIEHEPAAIEVEAGDVFD
ncbi:terminase small subunit [Rhodopseudomonas pseudopalustris]|uniref:Terminase small subunit n=1 Tax=Rhodopseudomonas pseudopalustris TaxID=1513892 RepID=A0A1H8WI38_9BRAD|nr:terminase small subunit [Rhodopseudomonas pseudopalustris]SEP27306.1 Terminase small subunit [Rhodopseudomonas pseudopalustris]